MDIYEELSTVKAVAEIVSNPHFANIYEDTKLLSKVYSLKQSRAKSMVGIMPKLTLPTGWMCLRSAHKILPKHYKSLTCSYVSWVHPVYRYLLLAPTSEAIKFKYSFKQPIEVQSRGEIHISYDERVRFKQNNMQFIKDNEENSENQDYDKAEKIDEILGHLDVRGYAAPKRKEEKIKKLIKKWKVLIEQKGWSLERQSIAQYVIKSGNSELYGWFQCEGDYLLFSQLPCGPEVCTEGKEILEEMQYDIRIEFIN